MTESALFCHWFIAGDFNALLISAFIRWCISKTRGLRIEMDNKEEVLEAVLKEAVDLVTKQSSLSVPFFYYSENYFLFFLGVFAFGFCVLVIFLSGFFGFLVGWWWIWTLFAASFLFIYLFFFLCVCVTLLCSGSGFGFYFILFSLWSRAFSFALSS